MKQQYDFSNTTLAQENKARSLPFPKEKPRSPYILMMKLSTGFEKPSTPKMAATTKP